MKIINNNIRAAKRHLCGLVRGANGTSYRDFSLFQRDVAKRTHDKSKNAANDKESDSTAPTP